MYTAVRRVTPWRSFTSQRLTKASLMMRSRRLLISSSVQKNELKSCTHSKYDTVTPPALASTSGTTVTPRSASRSSAAGMVGPLAPSTIRRALIRPAFSSVICFSSAAGISTSQSTSQNSSRFSSSVPGRPRIEPVRRRCSSAAAGSMPALLWMVPVTS